MGLADDLAALADLFERGLLSPEQFAEAKARLLASDDGTPSAGTYADYASTPAPMPNQVQGFDLLEGPSLIPDPEAAGEDEDGTLDTTSHGQTARRRTLRIGAVAVGLVLIVMVGASLLPGADEPAPSTLAEADEQGQPRLEYIPTAADLCVRHQMAGFQYLADNNHSPAAFEALMWEWGPQSAEMQAFRTGWGHYAGSLPENRDAAFLAMTDHFIEFCNATTVGPGAGKGEMAPVG